MTPEDPEVGAEDADFLLALSDFGRVVQGLASDPLVHLETFGAIAGGILVAGGRRIEFDLLDPTAFAGTHSGAKFFDYIRRYRSVPGREGPFVTPAAVWYMRLCVPDWLTYVQKILRDLRAGAPWSWMGTVLAIARRFGTQAEIVPRIRATQEAARMARLLPAGSTRRASSKRSSAGSPEGRNPSAGLIRSPASSGTAPQRGGA